MANDRREQIEIDVISDVVCPWCFLGMKRLSSALAEAPDITATVRWRPYQLDPNIPAGGLDRKAYMQAKFGDGDKLARAHATLESLGAVEGIVFNFGAITVSPNTLDAHRLIRWAGGISDKMQERVVASLFRAYFEEGQNIGDPVVLTALAQDNGMDGNLVETLLTTDSDAAEVKQEIETASRMGVTGVPCFLFNGKYAVVGAQDRSVLLNAINELAGSAV